MVTDSGKLKNYDAVILLHILYRMGYAPAVDGIHSELRITLWSGDHISSTSVQFACGVSV
jgi:hypothetical protein